MRNFFFPSFDFYDKVSWRSNSSTVFAGGNKPTYCTFDYYATTLHRITLHYITLPYLPYLTLTFHTCHYITLHYIMVFLDSIVGTFFSNNKEQHFTIGPFQGCHFLSLNNMFLETLLVPNQWIVAFKFLIKVLQVTVTHSTSRPNTHFTPLKLIFKWTHGQQSETCNLIKIRCAKTSVDFLVWGSPPPGSTIWSG